MPDPTPTPPPAPAPKTQPHGYFNQAQPTSPPTATSSPAPQPQPRHPPAKRRRSARLQNPESLAAIGKAIGDYQAATATQAERELDAEKDRIARDNLVRKINARRMALQHAADALWPYTDSDNAPTRKAFQLPPDWPFNG